MRRREFLALVGAGAAWPRRFEGFSEEVVRVVGDLSDCNLLDHPRLDPNRRGVS
jgi:hypothetical protein